MHLYVPQARITYPLEKSAGLDEVLLPIAVAQVAIADLAFGRGSIDHLPIADIDADVGNVTVSSVFGGTVKDQVTRL